jgi:hypothetical protein
MTTYRVILFGNTMQMRSTVGMVELVNNHVQNLILIVLSAIVADAPTTQTNDVPLVTALVTTPTVVIIWVFLVSSNAEDIIKQAEETWVRQNDQYLVQPSDGDTRTPSQVLCNYMDKYGFDFETFEDEIDWIYFGNVCQDGDDIDADAIDLGALSLS